MPRFDPFPYEMCKGKDGVKELAIFSSCPDIVAGPDGEIGRRSGLKIVYDKGPWPSESHPLG